jgi:hypothetical protein
VNVGRPGTFFKLSFYRILPGQAQCIMPRRPGGFREMPREKLMHSIMLYGTKVIPLVRELMGKWPHEPRGAASARRPLRGPPPSDSGWPPRRGSPYRSGRLTPP